jgi:hypothetical protein
MKMKYVGPLMFFMIFFLSACCGKVYTGKQEVDVRPLIDAQVNLEGVDSISTLFDVKTLGKVVIQEDKYARIIIFGPSKELPDINPFSEVDMTFSLADDVESAREDFQSECRTLSAWSIYGIKLDGEQDNQFCISYVYQRRVFPEVCSPTNQYNSFVVFQKDRLVIAINEYTESESGKDITFSKDAIIRLLAQELTK